jgi:hypothetical protein
MYVEQMTQALSIQGQIAPVSQGAGSVTTTFGVDMQKFRRALAILNVGAFGASATVDMKLVESNSANLAGATDVAADTGLSSCAITQLVAAGGNNRFATLEIRAGQVTKRYVGVTVTVGTAATLIQVTLLGGEAIEKPGNASDIAAVAQRAVAA